MNRLAAASAAAVAAVLVFAAPAVRADPATPSTPIAAGEKKILIGGEALLGLPLGQWADVNSLGIGLMLDGEFLLMPQITLTGRLGYEFHLSNNDLHSGVIPLLGGARYYISAATPHQGIFAFGELGFNYVSYTVSNGGFSATGSNLDIGLGAGAGYQMGPIGVKVGIQAVDIGNFGNTIEVSVHGVYQFYGL